MPRLCWQNGRYQPATAAIIPATDLGVQRGYGVFEYARTVNGRLFHFDAHLARLRRSAAALHLDLPHTDAELTIIAQALVDRSQLAQPAVRLLLTGGDAHHEPLFAKPTFLMLSEELPQYDPVLYHTGVNLMTVPFQRQMAEIKSLNYLHAFWLEPQRRERGVFDTLYTWDGRVSECPRSNFFGFLGDRLVTSSVDILAGITRGLVLEMAAARFGVEVRPFLVDELSRLDEAFVTSTTKGVMPVTEINGRLVGDGRVGRRTQWLMNRFAAHVAAFSGGD